MKNKKLNWKKNKTKNKKMIKNNNLIILYHKIEINPFVIPYKK